MIALERLESWTSVATDRSLSINDRITLAISSCHMLKYWQERNLFCWDVSAPSFGVDRAHLIVKLIDIRKLMETPPLAEDACTTDRQCIPRFMRDSVDEDLSSLSD